MTTPCQLDVWRNAMRAAESELCQLVDGMIGSRKRGEALDDYADRANREIDVTVLNWRAARDEYVRCGGRVEDR